MSSDRFTEGAKQAMHQAREEAIAANQPFVGTEHVALALVCDDGVAGSILRDLGVTHEDMRAQIGRVLAGAERPAPSQGIPTSRTKRVMGVAFQEATAAGAEVVGTEHLLVALLVEAEGVAAQVFDDLGVTLPRVRRALRAAQADRPGQPAGIVEAVTVEQGIGNAPGPGAPVGTSSSLGALLMLAGQLAREEGSTDVRADHLIRAIATADTVDLRGTLARLGLSPDATVRALMVPDEIRQLGLAAQRARVDQAADGAVAEAMRLGRAYTEAVWRWLTEGSGP